MTNDEPFIFGWGADNSWHADKRSKLTDRLPLVLNRENKRALQREVKSFQFIGFFLSVFGRPVLYEHPSILFPFSLHLLLLELTVRLVRAKSLGAFRWNFLSNAKCFFNAVLWTGQNASVGEGQSVKQSFLHSLSTDVQISVLRRDKDRMEFYGQNRNPFPGFVHFSGGYFRHFTPPPSVSREGNL